MISERRQSLAKKKTASIPPIAKHHQIQLACTPPVRTHPVTTSGVSTEKEVATIDVPASHHGRSRPETKNSAVDELARRTNHRPTPSEKAKYSASTNQSSQWSCEKKEVRAVI